MASKPSPVRRSTRKGSTGETASTSSAGGIGRWWVNARAYCSDPAPREKPWRRCCPKYPLPPTTSTRFLASAILCLGSSRKCFRDRFAPPMDRGFRSRDVIIRGVCVPAATRP
ncbi:hypothetical protein BHE74_00023310 [Ensete ventricosum]|uniref:Uncharacterized protein n=1 Tax=Ensete ventricosum TaxID=4639 RepID=A0A427AHK7_ENSVE|nr:hypothetical protein B296_00010685 [Ensete ventricosum]RWW69126.1 hypothetical protein BHE74_00023310 [Ensete ventricosum]